MRRKMKIALTKKDKDCQVAEAEVLSEVGKALPKKEAALRVTRMVKLLKAVKKDVGAAKGKPLDECMAKLEKLQKRGDKVSLDHAKGKPFDAAIQIKKVKKM
jgi:predicted transcriptional regulator